MTTFEPTSSGIDADQLVVPFAVPDWPVLVDHVTEVTPVLSLAVPLNEIVAAEVETDVAPGETIVNVGGAVSGPPPVVVGGADAACLVIVTDCETWLDPAVAVTVIVLAPMASAIFEIVHADAEPDAVPDIATDDEAVDHVTVIAPDPPEAAPASVTDAAVVVDDVVLTVSVSAGAEGVGVGVGGVEPVVFGCAAYSV